MINELIAQWDGFSPSEQKAIINFAARKAKKVVSKDAEALLICLNEQAGRNYRPVKSNLSRLQALLADGYTFQEVEQVIARKCLEWRDNPQMEQYLRPKTLFSAENFSNYFGQLNMKPPEDVKPKLKRPNNDNEWLILAKKAGAGSMDSYDQIWQKATSLYDAGRLQ
jgi:uncharacterized phage protein (TIGR02220 family)